MASSSYPIRNIDKLHCSTITYHCALGDPRDAGGGNNNKSPCISCAYKICNFDVALDCAFSDIVPNVRPECCPRSSTSSSSSAAANIMVVGYQKGMHVLTVGDGDFSFSSAIARAVIDKEDAISSGKVVATSYENEQTLQNVYPEFTTNLHQLTNFNNTKRQSIVIGYNVDATNLSTTLPNTINNQCNYFHRIVWNFPCTAILAGQDGQNDEMECNKDLVRKFVCNALPYLSNIEGSDIHLLHKTKPPYNQWLLEKVALEGLEVSNNYVDDDVKGDCNHETKSRKRRRRVLEYKGRLVFDKCIYQPYTPRKALDKRSFPCHDACIYIFGWKENNKSDKKSKNEGHHDSREVMIQSTIPPVSNNNNLTRDFDDLKSISSQLTMAVTPAVIDRIRSVHIAYATKKRMTNSAIQDVDSKNHMTSKRRRKK